MARTTGRGTSAGARQSFDWSVGRQAESNSVWNVYHDVANQGWKIQETNTVPETQFRVTQGTLTIDEYANSVPYTGKLDNFSKHPVTEIINKALKNDAKKTFDIAAYKQFDQTPLKVAPTGGTSTDSVVVTTNGTTTQTNNVALGKEHIKAIVDEAKERNIPPYMGDDYFALSHPTTYREFKNDLESIHQHTEEGFGMVMNGEIGRYESTRFVEQTNIPKGGAEDSTTFDPVTDTPDAWDNGKSSWMFLFGEDTVAEAIVIPEEIRGKIPEDYGRSRGIAWLQ